jgi:hypothetical protein
MALITDTAAEAKARFSFVEGRLPFGEGGPQLRWEALRVDHSTLDVAEAGSRPSLP